MRSIVTLLVLMLGLTVSAVANCGNDPCTCGSPEAHEAHEAQHAAEVARAPSAAAPAPDGLDVQMIDLKPQRFVVYKGVLADVVAIQTNIVSLTSAQDLLDESTHAWSIMPRMPMSEEELLQMEYWAARTISATAQPTGELEAYVSPGGKYIMTVHTGPYEQLADAWAAFAKHTFQNYQINMSRPMLEHYVNAAESTPADELITQLYIPIE